VNDETMTLKFRGGDLVRERYHFITGSAGCQRDRSGAPASRKSESSFCCPHFSEFFMDEK
jgi:hypothetical protein